MDKLTDLSVKYMTETDLAHRKTYGQYMTPPSVSSILFNQLAFQNNQTVLDPAVGTGELLLAAQKLNPTLQLVGFDTDLNILNIAKQNIPSAQLTQHNLFDPVPTQYEEYFDFIIGNPPYFELKKNQFNSEEFLTAGGRANIYALFFERYTSLLKTGGTLAYIVPPSMNAGAFFTNLRQYILNTFTVKFLKIVRQDDYFQDAQTAVQIIVLTKTKDKNVKNNPYIIDFNTLTTAPTVLPTIFTDNKPFIVKQWKGKANLHQYGFKVSTGTICWNDFKTSLTATANQNSQTLYYAKDISVDNKIVYSKTVAHKRFLTCDKPALTGDTVLVNRIVGSVNNPKLKCAYVSGKSFYAENHLNVIQAAVNVPQITLYEVFKRLTGFTHLGTYLQALTGNTQLSAKELNFLLPL